MQTKPRTKNMREKKNDIKVYTNCLKLGMKRKYLK